MKLWHSPAAAVAKEPGRIHHANSWLNISGERVTGKGPHDCHGTQISCAKGATCAHKSLSVLQKIPPLCCKGSSYLHNFQGGLTSSCGNQYILCVKMIHVHDRSRENVEPHAMLDATAERQYFKVLIQTFFCHELELPSGINLFCPDLPHLKE